MSTQGYFFISTFLEIINCRFNIKYAFLKFSYAFPILRYFLLNPELEIGNDVMTSGIYT